MTERGQQKVNINIQNHPDTRVENRVTDKSSMNESNIEKGSRKENYEQRAFTRVENITETSEKRRVKANKWRPSFLQVIAVCVFACMIAFINYNTVLNKENMQDETNISPVCNIDVDPSMPTQTPFIWIDICICLAVVAVSSVAIIFVFEIGRLENLTELSSSIEGKTKKSTKELINFCHCDLAGDHLSLLKKLTDNKYKIEGDILNIEDANTLNLHQFNEIGHLISVHHMGVRIPPGIKDEELAQLFGGFKEGKLNELDMSCSQNLTTQHFRILSKFIATNSIKILTLCGCELEGSYMDAFHKALSEKPFLQTIDELDLSFITTLEPEDYKTIGKIIALCKVKKITFDGCELNYRHLQHFEVSDLKEIVEMDLSCCENLSGKGFRILANIVANTGIECLILGGCKLNKTNIEAFYNELQLHKSTELKELNLGYNPTLEPDDFKTIGHIVALCKVEKITLAGCKLKESHLQKFKTCGFKLRTLDMGDNGYIGDGFTALAEIVEKFRLVELNISDCMINKSELQMFRKKLGKLKINRLNLSDYDRSPDESYIKEVCQLLPNVTDIIYLEFKNLTISCRRRLQCELNKLPETATEIRLTDETIRWQGTAKCICTS